MNLQAVSGTPSRLKLLGLPLVIAVTLALLYFGAQASNLIRVPLVPNAYVDAKVNYQLITLILVGVVLAATYALSPTSFRKYFRRGQIDAPVEPVKLIGIGPNETWLSLGRNFAIVISIVTFAVIYVGFMQGRSLAPETVPYLPWIVVLALSNSFVEEMITRLGVISALDQLVPRQSIYLISAAILAWCIISARRVEFPACC